MGSRTCFACSGLAARCELADEGGVGGCGKSLLQYGQQAAPVQANQGIRIQPQTRKNLRPNDPVGIRQFLLELATSIDKPEHGLLPQHDDQILSDPGEFVIPILAV